MPLRSVFPYNMVGQRRSTKPLNKEEYLEQIHRLFRDMVDDKSHNRHHAFQRNLRVLQNVAARHAHVREDLAKGIIRNRPLEQPDAASSKRRRC